MTDDYYETAEYPEGLEMLTRIFSEAYRIDNSDGNGETDYVSAVLDVCRQPDSDFNMTVVNICKAAGFVYSGVGDDA